jgi:hypothetical protein
VRLFWTRRRRVGCHAAIGERGHSTDDTFDSGTNWIGSNIGSIYAPARLSEGTPSYRGNTCTSSPGTVLCMKMPSQCKVSLPRCSDEINDHPFQMRWHRLEQSDPMMIQLGIRSTQEKISNVCCLATKCTSARSIAELNKTRTCNFE